MTEKDKVEYIKTELESLRGQVVKLIAMIDVAIDNIERTENK